MARKSVLVCDYCRGEFEMAGNWYWRWFEVSVSHGGGGHHDKSEFCGVDCMMKWMTSIERCWNDPQHAASLEVEAIAPNV